MCRISTILDREQSLGISNKRIASLLPFLPAFLRPWASPPEFRDPVDAEAAIHAGEHGTRFRRRHRQARWLKARA
jgi:hypothetical protein